MTPAAQSVRVGPRGTVRVLMPRAFSSASMHADTIPDAAAPGQDLELLQVSETVGALVRPRVDPSPVMPALSHTAELCAGEVFRGYVVAGLLAEGGTAFLYDATHVTSMKRCLIKVLKPSYRGSEHVVMQKKLIAEGKFLMAAGGRNPFLVTCHDVGLDQRFGPFLIMDHVEGDMLAVHIAKQRSGGKTFDPMTVVNLGISLCVGLQMAHESGAVHRDLKPANILMRRSRGGDQLAVIIDWGAAKSTFSPDTRYAPVFGTLAYMSPEQIDRGPITAATDEYALAIVLMELLWRHPFVSDASLTEAQLIARMRVSPPDKPPAVFVPRKLWAILERSLSKNPEQRYGSCESLGAALAEWAKNPDKVEEQTRATAPVRPTVPLLGLARGGARMPTPAPTELVDPAQRLRMDEVSEHASLIIRNGVHEGARFALDGGRIVLGRHPGMSHVVLTDDKVTQRHAALECVIQTPSKPMYSLVDLGSLNGVSVGGVRLSSGPEFDAVAPDSVVIRAGDTFVLGDVEIVLAPAGRLGELGVWETVAEARAAREAKLVQPKKARQVFRVPLTQKFLAPTVLVQTRMGAARYHLERETILGSSSERSNIVVEDEYVSRAHLRLTHVSGRFGGGLTVVADDLDSANGMCRWEGRRLVRVESAVLFPGDKLAIGRDAAIELTVLAPGAFDADAGEFIACDEHGQPIPPIVLVRDPRAEARPRGCGATVAIGVLFLALVIAGVLITRYVLDGRLL